MKHGVSRGIEALRGLAALLVFLHHLSYYGGLALPGLDQWGGALGVRVFFLISGFLIIQSAVEHPASVYVVRRLARIFPCYLVVTVPLLFVYDKLPLTQWWPQGGHLAASLLMLSLWVPPALSHYDMVRVSWTLSIELAWYALALLMAGTLALHRARVWWVLLLATAGMAVWWRQAAVSGALDALFQYLHGMPIGPQERSIFIVGNVPGLLVFFVAGAASWRAQVWWLAQDAWVRGGLLLALLLPALWRSELAMVVLPLMLFLGLWQSHGPWLMPLAWLGRISYPVYLVHVPLMLLAYYHHRLEGVTGIGLVTGLTLALSVVLHHVVEQPFMRLARRVRTPRAEAGRTPPPGLRP